MTHIITITLSKGGVGKTTTTLNLGAGLARLGRRVLLIDMDAQADLTRHLSAPYHAHVGKLMLGGLAFEETVHAVADNLDLIPSGGPDLITCMEAITNKMNRERQLARALKGKLAAYDYVLIDTAPALDLATNNALFASTSYIITQQPELYSYHRMGALIAHANEVADETNLDFGGVVVTRYNPSQKGNLYNQVYRTITEADEYHAYKTPIRPSVALAECGTKRQSVFDYAPESNGAKDYMAVAEEVIARYERKK